MRAMCKGYKKHAAATHPNRIIRKVKLPLRDLRWSPSPSLFHAKKEDLQKKMLSGCFCFNKPLASFASYAAASSPLLPFWKTKPLGWVHVCLCEGPLELRLQGMSMWGTFYLLSF